MEKLRIITFSLAIAMLGIVSCSKDPLVGRPGNNPHPNPIPGNGNGGNNGPGGDNSYKVKVKAVVGVGSIIYDSIPADLQITSWDSAGVSHHKQVTLAAGANNIGLPKAHLRYQLKLSKWGVSDEFTFTKDQVDEGTLISLGGTRSAKKLSRTEDFTLIAGTYQPSGKAIYMYNSSGSIKQVDYYQKKPQHSDLQLTMKHSYDYNAGRLEQINYSDGDGNGFGFITFMYDANEKIVNMHQKSYDQDTYGYVQYEYMPGQSIIKIDYLYSNGFAMAYTMNFKGGNKIKDAAISSTGAGEGGTYTYDFNINPYVHMNMPDIYLSNLSKNNLTGQEKGYGGSIPSGIPYKYEYTYDADGYPAELIRSYKSYTTGQHLYTTKTVYTY